MKFLIAAALLILTTAVSSYSIKDGVNAGDPEDRIGLSTLENDVANLVTKIQNILNKAKAKLNDSKWATLAKKVYTLANTAYSKATKLSNDVKALRKKFDTLNFLQKIDEVAQLANKAGEIAGTVSELVSLAAPLMP